MGFRLGFLPSPFNARAPLPPADRSMRWHGVASGQSGLEHDRSRVRYLWTSPRHRRQGQGSRPFDLVVTVDQGDRGQGHTGRELGIEEGNGGTASDLHLRISESLRNECEIALMILGMQPPNHLDQCPRAHLDIRIMQQAFGERQCLRRRKSVSHQVHGPLPHRRCRMFQALPHKLGLERGPHINQCLGQLSTAWGIGLHQQPA